MRFINKEAQYSAKNIVSQIKLDEIDQIVVCALNKDGTLNMMISKMPAQTLSFMCVQIFNFMLRKIGMKFE